MIETIKKKIEEAQLVLIGIGEECELKIQEMEQFNPYAKAIKKCESREAVIPYIEKLFLQEEYDILNEKIAMYQNLAELIKDKNYFVVSLCRDGIIHSSGLLEERMVEPCGTLQKMQCSHHCCNDFHQLDPLVLSQVKAFVEDQLSLEEIKEPVCPNCGEPLVFNTILAENYAEEGYLKQWELYTKWLQGTLNKTLCIFELGVGLDFPTVIRWPFEKIAFFNQKASFFRVHSKLYQIAEEISGRGFGIHESVNDFLKELSKES